MIATTLKLKQTSDLPMAPLKKQQKRKTSAVKRSIAVATMLLVSSCGCGVEATVNPAASAAISALKKMDYRYFVAGGTCAAFSHGITTPIDVVKTRLQANPEVSILFPPLILLLSERLIGGELRKKRQSTNICTNSDPSHSFLFIFCFCFSFRSQSLHCEQFIPFRFIFVFVFVFASASALHTIL